MAEALLILFILQDVLLALICDRLMRFVAVSAKAIENFDSSNIDAIANHVGAEWEKEK